MNKHYFSIMIKGGRDKIHNGVYSIEDAIEHVWIPSNELLASVKGEGRLMAMGYNAGAGEMFGRKETLFTHMSVMMIDCDNKKTNGDPKVMDMFNEYMNNYEFWTYESASSTSECPRFRALIPLDRPLRWSKHTKKAIGRLFSMFVDDGASWFEEPLRHKLSTIKHHEGKEFPASVLENVIVQLEDDEKIRMDEYENKSNQIKLWRLRHPEYQPKKVNVSNNEKVRHYLDTPYLKMSGNGDSDNSLYRAICVCVVADDEDTLELVKTKARCERWTSAEIERKVREARRYVKH